MSYNNIINYPYIDYIIKAYVPNILEDRKNKNVNMNLFRQAMQHCSTKKFNEDKTYERLEFLGDSIFHLILTEYLYYRYDEENEGFLTRLRIRLERGDSMAELTKILEIDQYIQVNYIQINDNILEDVFEAFIGAFYLNFGFIHTRTFIVALIEKHKNLSELINYDDNYKDLLLRYFHQMKWGHPKYNYTIKNGIHKSSVNNINGKIIGIGSGMCKKKSEQIASQNALIRLKVIIDGVVDENWLDIIKDKNIPVEKEKNVKKTMSIFNPENELLSRDIIKSLFENYSVSYTKKFDSLNLKIFNEAMTHRSYIKRKIINNKDKVNGKDCVRLQPKSNERLQFLGDAIIHFIIGEYLYNNYPDEEEGFMTRLRCKLENQECLFKLSRKTQIDAFLLISQAIEIIHGRKNVSIVSGGFEAFFGALFIETGLKTCRNLFIAIIKDELNIEKISDKETNYKEMILQIYNKNHWGAPDYRILKEEGPGHIKVFTVGLYFNNKCIGKGKGASKKKAEQLAAQIAYKYFTF